MAGAGVIVYTWLVYPAAVRLSGALARGVQTGLSNDTPLVSVIIASREPAHVLAARTENIALSTYPCEYLEILIALDATRTPDSLAAHPPDKPQANLSTSGPRVVVLQGDAPGGKAAALNAAVRAARGSVLVFTDSYQEYSPQTVADLVRTLASDKRLGAVSGTLDIEGGPWLVRAYWRYERWLRYWESRLHSSVGVTGAVYAMRRELWKPIPPGLILDDLYIPMRLVLDGYRIGWSKSARARDARRFDVAQEGRRKARTLTGVLQLCAWLPEVLLPWRNPIWLQFVSHKLLRLFTPYALFALLLGLVIVAAEGLDRRALLTGGALAGATVGLGIASSARLREALASVVAVQLAALRAVWNAVRGNWDVW
jgi:cellulose synthase/poly-beta-1,6-N-acetylglucosamine synthase-like glycosyltransferase